MKTSVHRRILPGNQSASNRSAGSLAGVMLVCCLCLLVTVKADGSIRIVTSGSDSGPGTLRDTILYAAPGDTITFASSISTIDLMSGELLINKNLTINGPGSSRLTVQRSAAAEFRIFNIDSTSVAATISGLKIADGRAPIVQYRRNGGGILNNGSLTIVNCTLSGNGAPTRNYDGGYGGGVFNGGLMTIISSTISGNSAGWGGGGIASAGRITISNSTISGNTAPAGGGISNYGAASPMTTLTACTISTNWAQQGGGVYNGGGTVTARSTIIALNTDFDIYGSVTSQNFNVLGTDPLLGPLQDNGGQTFTHALLPGSPALDAGDDSVLDSPPNLSTDQRGMGFPRKSGAHVDIGAFEISPAIPEIVVTQPAGSNLRDGVAKKSFGTVKVGKSGKTKTFTIMNIGRARLTGLAIAKDGTHKKNFSVTGPTRTTLAAGASATFKVTFKPSAKGTRNAAIHIKSNDANEDPFDIKLTGMGVAQ